MPRLPNDKGDTPLPVSLRHQLLDPQYVRTGGVDTHRSQLLQTVKDLLALPVGADDHRLAGADLLHGVHLSGPQRLQLCHHMDVVDDAAQHGAAALFTGCLLRQLHSPLHAVTETGAFGYSYLCHWIPPSA